MKNRNQDHRILQPSGKNRLNPARLTHEEMLTVRGGTGQGSWDDR